LLECREESFLGGKLYLSVNKQPDCDSPKTKRRRKAPCRWWLFQKGMADLTRQTGLAFQDQQVQAAVVRTEVSLACIEKILLYRKWHGQGRKVIKLADSQIRF